MFRAAVRETPFCTEIANDFFGSIFGQSYNGDNTFLSTMRAVLAHRMGEDDSVELLFTNSSYRSEQVSGATKRDVMRAVTSNIYEDSSGRFYIHSINGGVEGNNICFDAVESEFTSKYDGFHKLEPVTAYFKKSFRVLCFISVERKSVVLFVEALDIRKLHYLQRAIVPCMPWYFNTGKDSDKLTEDELALFLSLTEKEPDKYMACLSKLAERYDFKTMRLEKMLKGFELRYERLEVDRVRAQIAQKETEFERLNDQIGSVLAQRNDLAIKLLGLNQKIDAGVEDSEIMDYFMCNNNLYLERVSDTVMEFSAFGYCEYFDEEMVEAALRNNRSFIYSHATNSISGDRMAKLFKAIFIDRILRVRFCAAYTFDLNGSVRGVSHHEFPTEMENMMPNPHIQYHRCLGGNERIINNLLRDRNYIGAIEQCVASSKSLNFGDGTVIGEFMVDMYRNRKRFIELPDGSVVKTLAAIEWLESQEATGEDGTTQEPEEEA